MKSFSQNNEDLFILNYFGDFKGTLLSIGENDGVTFSNSRLLIEHGWKAHLIEPGAVYDDLSFLYKDGLDDNVHTYKLAIGDKDDKVSLYDSGPHVPNGTDKGLVSTTDINETKRWLNVEFKERRVWMKTFKSFIEQFVIEPKFDFISIDTEGNDLSILKQIDLNEVGCRCLIVEWNTKIAVGAQFIEYCAKFQVYLRHTTPENLIFCK